MPPRKKHSKKISSKKFRYTTLESDNASASAHLSDKINLQELFNICNTELGLQQTKRDQIIVLYLTICSLVSSIMLSDNVTISTPAKSGIFGLLFILGMIGLGVVSRYRIYKEVYWISCHTISNLYSVDITKIDKAMIQYKFYQCLRKSGKDHRMNRKKDNFPSGKMSGKTNLPQNFFCI